MPISFLYFNFSLPCFHRTCSIFSVDSKSDSIWASFYGSNFGHFSYSVRFWFSAFNIELFEILLNQENKEAYSDFLVYLTTWLTFKAYLFALEFPLSKVKHFISPIVKITLYFFVAFVLYIWLPANRSVGLNWCESITCLS